MAARQAAALLLAALLAAAALPARAADANATQLLLSFKATFSNGAALLPSWNTSVNPDACSGWQGVGCDADGATIRQLDLGGAGLRGAIPSSGWPLPATLTHLLL